jgi:hypothetical protein
MQPPEEKLGSFYLGAEYDPVKGCRTEKTLHYDSRDLTTHAVCVGMTGSGKTGLCIGLLEEAALDRIPVLLIDPKGDMTNMLLQFPELRSEDFRPWINEDDARRKGKTADEFAAATAELWKTGLADWGIGPQRISELKEAADYTIYTPGSDSGISLSILGSLKAPAGLNFEEHAETITERISGTVTALLGLAGISADPVRSREAILLCGIFEYFWKAGKDLDLSTLIMSVQNPPMRQVGVFDTDTFFPEKDRFALAMSFNALLASPSFQSWLSGDPLDISSLLYASDGKPRVSICYLAHLSESERMFFVTLLLENFLTWMRTQPGTSSLRALLYFDEVFGFLPPVAEPSSKRPLLTLLKQARAFGVGCVLVTQNPVDLDYKGLTNTGTWFIGKLQAERDKMRVLEGLKSAIAEAGGSADTDYDTLISQLTGRVFLMHNVHEDRPVVFQTRWAMSYLSGPMTKPQIQMLMKDRKINQLKAAAPRQPFSVPASPDNSGGQSGSATAGAQPDIALPRTVPAGFSSNPPGLDPGVKQVYFPLSISSDQAIRELVKQNGSMPKVLDTTLVYEPSVLGSASVMFSDRKMLVNEREEYIMLYQSFSGTLSGKDWKGAERVYVSREQFRNFPESPEKGGSPVFAPVPEEANNQKKLAAYEAGLADWLYYNSRRKVASHKELGLFQLSGEDERSFSIRLQQAAREKRDAEIDELEKKFKPRIDKLQERIGREERELEKDEAEHQSRKVQELAGIGETVLGLFLGRKSTRAISSAISNRRMTVNAQADVRESQETVETIREELERCNSEMKQQADEISQKWDKLDQGIRTEEIAPRRSDINVDFVALAWLPLWRISYSGGAGFFTCPAYGAGSGQS